MKLQPAKKIANRILASLIIISITSILLACHEEDEIDFRAPIITIDPTVDPSIDAPTPGSNVTSSTVTIIGTISSDVVLVELSLLDDMDNVISTVQATLDGTTFSGDLTLAVGDNKISALAQDAIGNRYTLSFNLHFPQLTYNNGAAANLVIGQADFISNATNRGSTPAANSLSGVQGALFEKELTTLYIPDKANNRILGFNAIPDADGVDANFALGQADLTSSNAGTSATALMNPEGIYTTTTQLFVVDSGNNRVLIWNSHPTANTVAANYVLGQLDFDSSASGCSSSTLSDPAAVMVVDNKILVLDRGNNRLLIWSTFPDEDNPTGIAAGLVIGQVGASAMDTCEANDSDGDGATDTLPSASTLNNPGGFWTDGVSLLIADTGNHRVLVWDTFPTSNGEPADWVIGQPDMGAAVAELNQNSLNSPLSVYSNRAQIFVADTGNARVLMFNNFPAANEMNADTVIGQADFVSNTTGTSDSLMSGYESVYVDRLRLFVADTNRVLIFDSQ